MQRYLTDYDDTAATWERALYAFLAEKERRSVSRIVRQTNDRDGPSTGSDAPDHRPYGATLHISDAGAALFAAIGAPAGVYIVVSDGGRVSNQRF